MDVFSVFLFYSLASALSGNIITPDETELFAEEGSNITLSCSYSSADYLYWYRQYPRAAPEFLELILDGTKSAKNSDVDQRLSIQLTKREQKHVDLIITSAAVSDSALYYCALRPTVTGNTQALYKNPLLNERKSASNEDTITPDKTNEFAAEGVSFGDKITADSTEESAAVGSTVTLSCSYSSAESLQWYRQYPGSAPQFLVLIIESVKDI
ncbi:hypothetical protein QQF64_015215 [Cirrhinus molitorella]|uniref:Ig-like domain-containing protein n=1 Tax=Cirrhinus molitorella TaxID=172907 RepID=A0ABR3NVS4_9TELE